MTGPRGTHPPLDLRAFDRALPPSSHEGLGAWPDSQIRALLAHVRALRAALQEAKGVVGWHAMQREKEQSAWYIKLEERIAAVLAQATDEEPKQ